MTQGALIRNVADCQALYMQAKQTRSDILYMTTLDTGRCSHHVILYRTSQHCAILCCTAMYCTVVYCPVVPCTDAMLPYSTLPCTAACMPYSSHTTIYLHSFEQTALVLDQPLIEASTTSRRRGHLRTGWNADFHDLPSESLSHEDFFCSVLQSVSIGAHKQVIGGLCLGTRHASFPPVRKHFGKF